MTAKLILIGGVSGVGKTTIAVKLSAVLGWPNLRIHPYILKLAREKGISSPTSCWNNLMYESMPEFVNDLNRWSGGICDHHFAVQPDYDSSYALGGDLKECLDEPYVKGIEDVSLDLLVQSGILVYPILLHSSSDQILDRRARLISVKSPRSLDLRSIYQEQECEERFFNETKDLLKRSHKDLNLKLENKEGGLDETFKSLLKHIHK